MSPIVSRAKGRACRSAFRRVPAECPDVGAPVDRAAARLLGAHVGGGAGDGAPECGGGEHAGSALAAVAVRSRRQAFARPKSSTFTVAYGGELDVRRLEVAMHDAASWAYSSAAASYRASGTASFDRDGPCGEPLGEPRASTNSRARRTGAVGGSLRDRRSWSDVGMIHEARELASRSKRARRSGSAVSAGRQGLDRERRGRASCRWRATLRPYRRRRSGLRPDKRRDYCLSDAELGPWIARDSTA